MPRISVRDFSIVLLFFAAVLSGPLPSASQPLWLPRHGDRAIAWEYLKPLGSGTTFFTSAHFLSGRYRLADIALVAEIPFAHAAYNSDSGDCFDVSKGVYFPCSELPASNVLGNPYLGIESLGHNDFYVEVGMRLPVVPNDEYAIAIGLDVDFSDRAEAFVPDYVPILTALNAIHEFPSGMGIRIRGGAASWIGQGGREWEWFALFAAQIGYWGERADITAGVSGRHWLTSELDFSDQTTGQLALALGTTIGAFEPSVNFRLPLREGDGFAGDLRGLHDLDIENWVVGVNVSVALP